MKTYPMTVSYASCMYFFSCLLKNITNFIPRVGRYSYVVAVLLALNLYFIAQLFTGKNSIRQYRELQTTHLVRSAILQQLKAKNDALKQDIDLLSEGQENTDYLEELAKAHLNYSYADEVVIVLPQ